MRIVAIVLAVLLPLLFPGAAGAQGRGGAGTKPAAPAAAAPRWPDGTINLGAPPGQTGMWDGGEPLTTIPSNYEQPGGRPRPGLVHLDQIPIQPWAKALLDARHARFLADEPYTRCKPSPAARAFQTAYGIELLNLPGSGRILLFQTGGAHSFRVIHTDGRSHPKTVAPSYFGHSIGWWDGDTLVVDTVGFNEAAWIDRGQLPHTDKLHLTEKYTRTSLESMRYELTIDDPGAYTAPFTGVSNLRWSAGVELFEYICQQANQADELMVGAGTTVDRSTLIIP